jgi:FkbM family methyltransferase
MATHTKRDISMNHKTINENYSFTIRELLDDPSNDHNLDYKVVDETWNENVYRLHEHQFKDNGVFLDIGANIGSVSLYVDNFNKVRDEGNKIKVYSVEPEPNNLSLLKENIKNNPTENITVINNAIWHEQKTVLITNKGGNSSIIDERGAESVEVLAITIQDFVDLYSIDEIDVAKIDIEGAEFDLIINTPPETLAKIKYITLEFDKSFDGRFGMMVEKLSKQFGLEILGSPERGGYIYGHRY